MIQNLYIWLALLTATPNYSILIGTYTDTGSQGIYAYTLSQDMSAIERVGTSKAVQNPSFLAYESGIVYAVNELDQGKVQSYSYPDFKLLSEQTTGGAHPCHIGISNGRLYAGNYSGGNLAAYKIDAKGGISSATDIYQNTGSGPVKGRQDKPHIHSVNPSPDGESLWVADLGTDEVLVFDTKDLKKPKRIAMKAGAGPRHITFHPVLSLAYVINELDNTITVVDMKTHALIQNISTLPEGFQGRSHCADIHFSPDGKFLYGSNRFSDTIAVFEVNEKSGSLRFVEAVPAGGNVPRNFAISPDGNFVLVALQDSNKIVIFSRDQKTGKLKETGRDLEVPKPVFVRFI
jgi:6-phosphogluconolactonase